MKYLEFSEDLEMDMICEMIRMSGSPDKQCIEGVIPVAARHKNISLPVLKLLVENGADPKKLDTNNCSALINYIANEQKSFDPEIANFLLEYSNGINDLKDHVSLLHIAFNRKK
jgi:hypothetical protein